ncbi:MULTISPECIES: fimbrial protein [unclassified Mesorhizobium]|uniref:fimbrial protein n=1 Tax=unclassified Mesorhizobium TaxID=325217 RepID=UPI001CCD1C67|nr:MULTISPECIES: fimbrial protein [unclassified Mesorhizobium]MBZ9742368.1 fimbrial protein [Mesorhizobium sp. CO1-1-4]MBZ9802423.1 fimbrial protein [Mesorhizobium sp. ES1-6]
MARPDADEEQEKPLDPEVDRLRGKLIRFMVINLGLLFVALMVVIGAIVYKARKAPSVTPPLAGDIQTPAGPASGDIVLPVGARVVSQSLSGDRLSIDAELADGSRAIFLYDLAERRLLGQFAIRNK